MTEENSPGLGLTHINERGEAHMVDVAAKPVTHRRALAEGFVSMSAATLAMIESDAAPKGDVFAVARVAGIMAAKRTSELIPLCHPIPLTSVNVDLVAERGELTGVRITASAETDGKTGVEMEALTAVSVAALTIYDMCKAVERGMTIGPVGLVHKDGGASGVWEREEVGADE